MSEETRHTIERLAEVSVPAKDIAASLGESEEDVKRVMRKQGWNLECPQKVVLLAKVEDLKASGYVTLSVVNAKRSIARGRIRLTDIMENEGLKHSTNVNFKDKYGTSALELEVEFKLFALESRSLDNNNNNNLDTYESGMAAGTIESETIIEVDQAATSPDDDDERGSFSVDTPNAGRAAEDAATTTKQVRRL